APLLLPPRSHRPLGRAGRTQRGLRLANPATHPGGAVPSRSPGCASGRTSVDGPRFASPEQHPNLVLPGMRIETREVVIVGGGPAGAVAGMLLARAGHDVLLLERQALPRRKACGDCISAGSTRLFERLGLLPAILELQCARLRGWRIVA